MTVAQDAAARIGMLVVDDESGVLDAFRAVGEMLGYGVYVAADALTALRIFEQRAIDLAVIDLHLAESDGQELMRELRRRKPELTTVVMTGFGEVEAAISAMKEGAFDYVQKPFSLDAIHSTLVRARTQLETHVESRRLRESLRTHNGFGNVVGRSPAMEKLFRIMAKVAQSSHPVLVLGESGTGKEMVARAIHLSGPRRDKPFIPVDCGALVPTLIESELFGHVKGAFTGANRTKEGLLAVAEGGTVFLDEIGELPIDLQSKLLRALQEKEIRPVGSTRAVPIHVRIIAATNRDLEQAVEQGTFRKDLYFRLNVVNLRIPPLRERREDIPILAEHFLERLNAANGTSRSLSVDAARRMMDYDWPGNVRELENCLERAAALSSSASIHISDLPTQMQGIPPSPTPAVNGTGTGVMPLADLERRAIYAALERTRGDKLMAARLLGIGKTTLYRKLKEYDAEAVGIRRVNVATVRR